MFDTNRRTCARESGRPFVAFDPVRGYAIYVDGKPRSDGTRRSRLPVGAGELPARLDVASNDERLRGRFVVGFGVAHGLDVWLEPRFDE